MAAPTSAVRLGAADVALERRSGGIVHLRSPHALGGFPRSMAEKLDYGAANAPDRVFLAQRESGGDWQRFTYAEVREGARRVAQSLLERKLSKERPVVVLSGNDIEHALIELGCLYAGIPYVPVSPSYSLLSTDFSKLSHIIELVTPGLVYASLEGAFAKAIEACVPDGVEVVFRDGFHQLEKSKPTSQVDGAHARATPDTIAKFLFTSGSTGMPKAVVNPHPMWC